MNLALFLPNWVGDAVMATPAVRALRQAYPTAHITGVLRPTIAEVLAGTDWLDDTILLERKGPRIRHWWAITAALRQRRIDLAILFPNSFRTALAAWLGGCRRRLGYSRSGRGLLLTDKLQPRRDAAGRFEVSPILDAYNLLAVWTGAPVVSRKLELATTPADESGADDVWERHGLERGGPVVCLNTGGAFGAAKLWPAHHFAELARSLVDRRSARVLVLCGPAEREQARTIVAAAQRPGRIASLTDGPVSLGLSKACVRRCDLLVTTDSGPRHFAAAFDRPVVSLFGPTHLEWTRTDHPKEICLQKKLPCGPCQQRVCPLGHHRCMTELTPNEVFAAALRLLGPSEVRHAG